MGPELDPEDDDPEVPELEPPLDPDVVPLEELEDEPEEPPDLEPLLAPEAVPLEDPEDDPEVPELEPPLDPEVVPLEDPEDDPEVPELEPLPDPEAVPLDPEDEEPPVEDASGADASADELSSDDPHANRAELRNREIMVREGGRLMGSFRGACTANRNESIAGGHPCAYGNCPSVPAQHHLLNALPERRTYCHGKRACDRRAPSMIVALVASSGLEAVTRIAWGAEGRRNGAGFWDSSDPCVRPSAAQSSGHGYQALRLNPSCPLSGWLATVESGLSGFYADGPMRVRP